MIERDHRLNCNGPANGLTLPSVAMVFQLRAINKRRILRKIGELEPEYMAQIDGEIWQLLKPLDSQDALARPVFV